MTLQRFSPENQSLRELDDGTCISGWCDPEYSSLIDAFEANFRKRCEIGASLCVVRDGRVVIDIWGGWARPEKQVWQSNTMSVVFSCTKGMAALCLIMLIQDGALDYDDEVQSIWPEFAQAGKARTTVAMLLDHTSPVPQFREPLKADAALDWSYMVRRIEREDAFWEPGTKQGYHGLNYAWTIGNIVRIVTGMPLGTFFRERIARSLGLDAYIGLPEGLDSRLAEIIPTAREEVDLNSAFYQAALRDRSSPAGLFLSAIDQKKLDTAPYHRAEIASANGIANARGLARLYSAMIETDGLLNAATIQALASSDTQGRFDEVLCRPIRFNRGFMKAMPSEGRNFDGFHVPPTAFGHVGMGGSVGFADPDRAIGFGYTMNRLGPTVLLNKRGQTLIDALYAVIDGLKYDPSAR